MCPLAVDVKGPDVPFAIAAKPKRKKRKPYQYGSVALGRRPTPLEERLLSLAEIPPRLNRLTKSLLAALSFLQRQPFTDWRDACWSVVREAAAYGSFEHRQEWTRQGVRLDLHGQAPVLGRLDQDLPLQRFVLDKATLLRSVAPTTREYRAAARGLVNKAFAVGRTFERQRLIALDAVQPELLVLSAILDRNTCDVCYDLDGTEFEEGSPEEETYAVPLDQCESTASGTSLCRCQVVAVGSEPGWVNAAIEHLEILHLRRDAWEDEVDLEALTPEDRSKIAVKAWDTRGRTRTAAEAAAEEAARPRGRTEDYGSEFFHGTSQKRLDGILKEGLKAELSGQIYPDLAIPNHVYFSDSQDDARRWAFWTAVDIHERNQKTNQVDAAILEIEIPAEFQDRIRPDENFVYKEAQGRFQFDHDIPPSWIKGVCTSTLNPQWSTEQATRLGKWACHPVSLSATATRTFYAPVILSTGDDIALADVHPLTPEERSAIAQRAWDTRGRHQEADVVRTTTAEGAPNPFNPQQELEAVYRTIRETADRFGLAPAQVSIVDRPLSPFTVGNQQFSESGHFNPTTNQIEVNIRDLSPQSAKGLMSHEAMHAVFQSVREAQDAEHRVIQGWDPREFESYFDIATGHPRPERLAELRQMFPASAAWANTWGDPYLSPEGTAREPQMITEDGHTDYTRAYWSYPHQQYNWMERAVNETLADVARTAERGTDIMEEFAAQETAPSALWQQLMRDLRAAASEIHTRRKQKFA